MSVRLRRPVPPHLHTWADVWATNCHALGIRRAHRGDCTTPSCMHRRAQAIRTAVRLDETSAEGLCTYALLLRKGTTTEAREAERCSPEYSCWGVVPTYGAGLGNCF